MGTTNILETLIVKFVGDITDIDKKMSGMDNLLRKLEKQVTDLGTLQPDLNMGKVYTSLATAEVAVKKFGLTVVSEFNKIGEAAGGGLAKGIAKGTAAILESTGGIIPTISSAQGKAYFSARMAEAKANKRLTENAKMLENEIKTASMSGAISTLQKAPQLTAAGMISRTLLELELGQLTEHGGGLLSVVGKSAPSFMGRGAGQKLLHSTLRTLGGKYLDYGIDELRPSPMMMESDVVKELRELGDAMARRIEMPFRPLSFENREVLRAMRNIDKNTGLPLPGPDTRIMSAETLRLLNARRMAANFPLDLDLDSLRRKGGGGGDIGRGGPDTAFFDPTRGGMLDAMNAKVGMRLAQLGAQFGGAQLIQGSFDTASHSIVGRMAGAFDKIKGHAYTASSYIKGQIEGAFTPTKLLTSVFILRGIQGAVISLMTPFTEFDKAMTESMAIMDDRSEHTRKAMERVALTISKDSIHSPAELAQAYYHLASAGLNANQSMAAMPLVDAFATAGLMDMKTATDLLVSSTAALGLRSENTAENLRNMTRVANVLTAANNDALGSVQDFASGLENRLAGALRASGKDVEEGAAMLMALSPVARGKTAGEKSAILINELQRVAAKDMSDRVRETFSDKYSAMSSTSATSHTFKHGQTLSHAISVSTPAINRFSAARKEMGMSVFDTAGKMLPMSDIIAQFEEKFNAFGDNDKAKTQLMDRLGLTRQAAKTIRDLIGTSEQMRANEAMLRQEAAAGGIVFDVANRQKQSYSAQLKIMGNNIAVAAIKIGEMLVPVLREVNKLIIQSVTWRNSLDPAVRQTIVTFGSAAVAIGVAVMAFRVMLGIIGLLMGPLLAIFSAGGLFAVGALLVASMAHWMGLFSFSWGKSEKGATSFFENVSGFMENFAENMKVIMEWLDTNWSRLWDNMGERVVKTMGALVMTVLNFFAQMLGKLFLKFAEFMDSVLPFGSTTELEEIEKELTQARQGAHLIRMEDERAAKTGTPRNKNYRTQAEQAAIIAELEGRLAKVKEKGSDSLWDTLRKDFEAKNKEMGDAFSPIGIFTQGLTPLQFNFARKGPPENPIITSMNSLVESMYTDTRGIQRTRLTDDYEDLQRRHAAMSMFASGPMSGRDAAIMRAYREQKAIDSMFVGPPEDKGVWASAMKMVSFGVSEAMLKKTGGEGEGPDKSIREMAFKEMSLTRFMLPEEGEALRKEKQEVKDQDALTELKRIAALLEAMFVGPPEEKETGLLY